MFSHWLSCGYGGLTSTFLDDSLPILFHLKLFGGSMSRREKIFDYFLLAVSITLSTVGTVWAFLPKSIFAPE